MRESGTKILAFAMVQNDEGDHYVTQICELASPDYCLKIHTGRAADILHLADNIETKFCDGELNRNISGDCWKAIGELLLRGMKRA